MGNIKRLEYLDYIKGFSILLVILGHIYDSSKFIKIWIYSFHIPLFFIISGALIKYTNIKKRSMKNIIVSKFKSLIIPYVCFELITILILMIKNDFTLGAFKQNVVESILMYCKAGATWFLPCIFVAEIVYIIVLKYIKNNKINIIFSLSIFLIPFFIKTENHYLIVILRCFTAYGFISFGYWFYELIINKEINLKLIVLLLISNIVISYFNGFVELWNLNFKNPILYTINSIIGTLLIIYAFKKINLNLNILKYFGINTIIIMSTQQVILNVISVFTGQAYYKNIMGIIVFIVTILIEIPIIEIINRYLPFMLGKNKVKVISD